jgi:hypothetical protein
MHILFPCPRTEHFVTDSPSKYSTDSMALRARWPFPPLFPPLRRNGLDVQVTPPIVVSTTWHHPLRPETALSFSHGGSRLHHPDVDDGLEAGAFAELFTRGSSPVDHAIAFRCSDSEISPTPPGLRGAGESRAAHPGSDCRGRNGRR